MLDWHSCQICYHLEIKIFLLLLLLLLFHQIHSVHTVLQLVRHDLITGLLVL